MGLISPGRENLLDFLEMRQVLLTYDGDVRDPLWWPQKRPVPMRVVRGPLGIPLPSMPGCNLNNDRMISVCFQSKPFKITVIQVYAPTKNDEEAKLNGSMKTYKTF